MFQGRYEAIVCGREGYLLELARYIHLNPVRAGLVRRPGEWKWSGHGEYLGREKRGLLDPGPVMGGFRTPAQYEAFVREGSKRGYRAEWHPGESAPFLGVEELVKGRVEERKGGALLWRNSVAMEVVWEQTVKRAGIEPKVLRRGGRSARLVQVRRRFMQRAVLEEGYRGSEVAAFLGCHASSVSRALQGVGDES